MFGRSIVIGVALLTCAGAVSNLQAQDEARLRKALEGKRVTVQIDMPASADGVDIFPGTSRPLDFSKYSGRLRTAGTAYRAGESAVVTKVKAKGSTIEIQLGGGGYGTFSDGLASLFGNNGADSGTAQQAKKANERSQALGAGSRFNLRFQNGATPEDMMPDAVVKALQEYATFPTLALAANPGPGQGSDATKASGQVIPVPASDSLPRKGMSSDDIERRWGKPSSTETNGQLTTSRYTMHSGAVEIDFFNGVAVDVRSRSSTAPGSVRKGMSLLEVEALTGKPSATSTNGQITTNKYRWQDGQLEADFVNGVLVGYRIASN